MAVNSITLIGSGNVAWHIALHLKSIGVSIQQVYSREYQHANELTKEFGGAPIDHISQLNQQADLYILALKDDIIEEIASQLKLSQDSILVHTSGSISIEVLKLATINYGSFYPLQTFTKNKPINFNKINICIEGSNMETEKKIMEFASLFSPTIHVLISQQRQHLHLAAVFANNFSNYVVSIAYNMCKEHNISFDLLLPLIQETFEKIKHNNPSSIQTGPAARGDMETIEKHLALLTNKHDIQEIYQLLTNQILKQYHDKKEL